MILIPPLDNLQTWDISHFYIFVRNLALWSSVAELWIFQPLTHKGPGGGMPPPQLENLYILKNFPTDLPWKFLNFPKT